MKDPGIRSVVELIDPPKGFQPWHGGPTLMGCLRGVSADEAAWKPAPDRHSIWELALHIAYWNYSVRRYLDSEAKKGFGRSPANWPVIDNPSEKQWKEDKQFIKSEHEKLVEAIKAFPEEQVDKKSESKKEWTYRQLLDGVAAHNTYHIGQIQLMKRLYKELAEN